MGKINPIYAAIVDIWISPMAKIFTVEHPEENTRTVSLLDTKTSVVNIFADFNEKTKTTIFGSLSSLMIQKRTRNRK